MPAYSFTKKLEMAGLRIAEERAKLIRYNAVLEAFPAYGSHLNVRIKRATWADYYFPPSMSEWAVVVRIEFSKTLAQKLTCLKFLPRQGVVDRLPVEPVFYKSGTSTLCLCGAGCRLFDFPIRYSERYGCALMEDADYMRYGCDDRARSGEERINVTNIGTGFTIAPLPHVDGRGYECTRFLIDAAYCSTFHEDVGRDGCEPTAVQKGFNYTVGSYVFRLTQYGWDYFSTGKLAGDPRNDSRIAEQRELLLEYEREMTSIRGGCSFIDPNATCAELGVGDACTVWSNEFNPSGAVYASHNLPPSWKTDDRTVPAEFQTDAYGFRRDENTFLGHVAGLLVAHREEGDSLAEEADFLASLLTDIGIDVSLSLVRRSVKTAQAALASAAAKQTVRVAPSMGARAVVGAALRSCARTAVRSMLATVGAIATGVGAVLFVAAAADLVLWQWDPMHFSEILSQAQLDGLAESSMSRMFAAYGSRNVPVTVEMLALALEKTNPGFDSDRWRGTHADDLQLRFRLQAFSLLQDADEKAAAEAAATTHPTELLACAAVAAMAGLLGTAEGAPPPPPPPPLPY